MGVPAGDIGGVIAGHIPVLDDKILEDLIEGSTNMNVAVGVGGAVMQDKRSLPLIAGNHRVIQVLVIHRLKHGRLPLGEFSPHGEVGFRQVNGLIVVHWLDSS
jgi:hypothetical protein